MPLSPAFREVFHLWGLADLMLGTGIPPHLFQVAVERENTSGWDSLPDNAYTEGVSSLHYVFETVEIDGIPIRHHWMNCPVN